MSMVDRLLIKKLSVGQLATNCYVIADIDAREALIVDPGDDADFIGSTLRDLDVQPQAIVSTHGHFDHILAAFEIQQAYKIPFYIHKRDQFLVERMRETASYFLRLEVVDPPPRIDGYLDKDSRLPVGNYKLLVIETPGHTPGSVCIYSNEIKSMITGDTIFAAGGIGRTDFHYSDRTGLDKSIRNILDYPSETVLYPGHGAETIVFRERKIHGLKNVQ